MWIGQLAGGSAADPRLMKNYVFPFKVRITDYVVNEPALQKWLHVVIPTEDIFQVDFDPEVIVFASNVKKLMNLGTRVEVEGTDYSNLVGIDKIFLSPKEEDLPAGAQNYYCSGTWPPVWVNDLDDDSTPEGATNQPAGRDACESIPSYGWTGSMCCGDDTTVDSKEFYADTTAGCWAGNKMPDNSRAMLVRYSLAYAGQSEDKESSCFDHTCNYDLPPVENVLVTNDYAEIYDLVFVGDIPKHVGPGGIAPTASSTLNAEDVPLQVLFYNESFWGCNAVDYIGDIQDTENLGGLVTEFVESPTDGTCPTVGAYFCDHAGGRNLGWNGESLSAYGENITLKDNTQYELKVPGSVPANLRTEAKGNFNLVKNGGFENV